MSNIMVCVTRQKTCQRLIDYGKSLMKSDGDQIFVIHVARENENFLGNREEGEALEFLYEKAREVGASLTVERSGNVPKTLAQLADKHQIDSVIVGESGEKEVQGGFLSALEQQLTKGARLIVAPAVSA